MSETEMQEMISKAFTKAVNERVLLVDVKINYRSAFKAGVAGALAVGAIKLMTKALFVSYMKEFHPDLYKKAKEQAKK